MLQLYKVFNAVYSLQSTFGQQWQAFFTVHRIIGVFFLLFAFFLFPNSYFLHPVFADNEFSSSYNINYDVDSSGVTVVTEKIALKNLTDRFYASSFNLSISATNVTDVAATDSQGPLEISTQNQGKKTNINVKFGQQVAGTGKEYPFTIKFKSKDFAQQQGRIWQVSIPKISSPGNLDKYDLTLSVPVSFGDPTSILPEPVKQSESAGKINFFFSKNQLTDSGISANFGSQQFFNFTLYYFMENNGLLPEIKEVILPSDSAYQKIILQKIEPKPENTYFDGDGNTIASFKLEKAQKINVAAAGLATLLLNSNQKVTLSDKQKQDYTSAQKYWEKDSPQISGKLNEIFSGKTPKNNQEKARLIYKYVVSSLSYDQERLKENNFQRLGALTALNNSAKALCLEFSDLFITLARAAGIPARELTGYAYSSNTDIRPLSLSKDILHAWAQYYDSALGWVMVDPTWENTTGGVDYFSKFDLNHLTLATRGQNSQKPDPPSDVRVEFGSQEATPSSNLNLQIFAPEELFAGFPSKIKVRIENQGNTATGSAQFAISSGKLDIVNADKTLDHNFTTVSTPPFGNLEYEFSVKSKSPVVGFEDNIEVKLGTQTISKKVIIKPFFAFSLFSFGVVGVIVLMFLIYLFTVVFHLKFHALFEVAGTDKKKS